MTSVLSEPARAAGGNAHARRTATVKSIFRFIVIFSFCCVFPAQCLMLAFSLGYVPSRRNRTAKRGYVHRYLHRRGISFCKRGLCRLTTLDVLARCPLSDEQFPNPGIGQRRTGVRPCRSCFMLVDGDGHRGGLSYGAGCARHRQGGLRCGRLGV